MASQRSFHGGVQIVLDVSTNKPGLGKRQKIDSLISKASENQTEICDTRINMAVIGGMEEKKVSTDQSSSTNPSGRKMYNRAMLLLLRESPLSNGKHDKLTFMPPRKEYSIVMKKRVEMDFLISKATVDRTEICHIPVSVGVIGNMGEKQVSVVLASSTNAPVRKMCTHDMLSKVGESRLSDGTRAKLSSLPDGHKCARNSIVPEMTSSGGVYVRNERFVRGLRLIYSYRSKSKRGDFSALVPLSTIQSTSFSSTSSAHDEVEPSLARVPQANNIENARKEKAQQNALLNALISPSKTVTYRSRVDESDRNASVIPNRIDDKSVSEKHQLFSNLRPLVKVGKRGENENCTVPKMTDNSCDRVDSYYNYDNMICKTNENRKSPVCETLFSTLEPLVSMDNGSSLNGRQKNDSTRTKSAEKVPVVPSAGVSKCKERNEHRNKERDWGEAHFQSPSKVMKIAGDASVVEGLRLSWALQPAGNRSSSPETGSGGVSEEIEKEDLDIRIRILLSELTDYDLDRVGLTSEIDSLPINGYQQMTRAVNLILDAALGVTWPAVVNRFSQLLSMLSAKRVRQPEGNEHLNFKLQLRLLIANRCDVEFEENIEAEFNRDTKLKAICLQLDPVKKKELHRKCVEEEKNSRMEFISFVRLAVELYKLEMLTANVIHRCIRHLLSSSDNASLECLCQLITAIGTQLKRTNDLGEYFTRLEVIANHHSQRTVSPDVRVLLKTAIRWKYDQ